MAGPRLNFAQVRLLGEAIKTPKGYQFPPTFGGSGGAGTGFTTASTVGSVIVGTLGTNGISMGVPAWLTAATAGGGGTGFTSASTAGTNIVATMGTNGLSMGIPAYLTTAMGSDASTAFAGNGFTTATTAGTAIVGTLSTNGLSMGIPAYLTTATGGGGAGTGFTTASTAGTDIVGTLDTNGLSMGIPAYLTAATAGGAGTGFTSASTAGSDIVATMGTNGLSMGVPAYLTTAMASDASSVFAGTAFSTTSTTGVNLVATINTAGIAMGVPAWLTTAALSQDSSKYAGTNAAITGGSITVNTSGVSIDLPAYLTTAMASDASSNFAGTAFSTTSTTGTNLVGTINTAGLAMGVPAWITTAMASGASSAFAGTGFTSATTAGTDVVGTLGTNGLSVGVPAYLTTFAYPRLDQVLDPTADKVFSMGSNQLQLSWATGGSFSTNATRQGMFELDVAGNLTQEADVIHLHQHGGAPTLLDLLHIEADGANVTGIRAQMSASIVAELNQPIKFTTRDAGYAIGSVPMILGTQMSNSVANLNANFVQGKASSVLAGTGFTTATTAGTNIVGTLQTNGLSMGVPAYLTTGGGGGGVAISNSQTLFSTGTVALSAGGGALTIASSAGGQSLMFSVPQTTLLVPAGGIVISSLGSTITISANLSLATQSYWANLDQFNNATTTMVQSNSFYVFPVTIPQNVAAGYLRLLGSFNFTSTTIATSAVNNATGASTAFSETVAWNAVFYSVGTGGSSRSLQYIASSSAGLTWAASVSQASTSNASRQSFTQAITFPNEGGNNASVTTQYSVSATNGPISTTQWSNLSAQRYLDIPFNSTFTAGNYWLAINRFSGTVGGKNMDCNATIYGVSNTNLTFANLNSATNVSNCFPFIGCGLWTQAAAGTSASIGLAAVSAQSSYMIPLVQLIKQA